MVSQAIGRGLFPKSGVHNSLTSRTYTTPAVAPAVQLGFDAVTGEGEQRAKRGANIHEMGPNKGQQGGQGGGL